MKKMNRKTLIFILLTILILTACSTDTNTKAITEDTTNSMANENMKTINVTAYQFSYEPSTIELKLGEPVRLVLTSSDVDHGFYVKELDINEKVSPTKETIVEFTPDTLGEFKIICSVYCGGDHNDMVGIVRVTN
ncbi:MULTISPECIES: cupredoxin domain-containing protein [unclassified Fusibacter]|uniref:cupredoxin domain-containing protein n=1 Tax=unclassified Fusibacter TaxID=2624464 RepID=UPI001011EA7C|nr:MULTISPECIES: cupredoxin domain-containing protein [unclassified Fusibacter]MCK8059716.1 cupredoxin domain-containing protein [Fusibacter sp. A2]NPE21517.1 cytochrome c oxidase subunit II [Fusibacter sp. A1]RXV61927.1 cytochrome c oxidase subunit II [Fusibacter sp. A1]